MLLLGPQLGAVSGVSTHLKSCCASQLAAEFRFRITDEEQVAAIFPDKGFIQSCSCCGIDGTVVRHRARMGLLSSSGVWRDAGGDDSGKLPLVSPRNSVTGIAF